MVPSVCGWQRLLSAPLFVRHVINRSQVVPLRLLHRRSASDAPLLGIYGVVYPNKRRYGSDASDLNAVCSDMAVKRSWCEETDPKPGDLLLRVGSFNLLAQHQIEKNIRLYKHCQPDDIDWKKRRHRLTREIAELSCDILCLQEVQVDHFDEYLRPFLEANDYECHFKSKTRACYDGCAIVFKRSRFALDHVEMVEFFRPDNRVLRADNVGIVVRLLPLDTPALGPICVANTHLYFNPNRGDIKLAQLTLLLATVDAVARRPTDSGHYPVLLCGDLNSEPTSNLLSFISSGSLENYSTLRQSDISDQNPSSFRNAPTADCLDPSEIPPPGVNSECQFIGKKSAEDRAIEHQLRHHLHFSRVFTNPNVTCPTREKRLVTSYTAHGVCNVDHILYTAPMLRLLGYRQIVSPDEFLRVGGIPNTFHGSDHIPLLANFALTTVSPDKK